MGHKKSVLIFIFTILLLIPFAFSQPKTEYPNIGGDDGDFNLGEGIFGSNINFITRGVGVSSETQVPLVLDLDGDGTNEIVLLDGNTIRIFNDSLGTKATISTGIDGRKSNMIAFDIDGNDSGRKELILVGEENELVVIVDWDGTDLTIQNRFNWSNPVYHQNKLLGGVHQGGEVIIACESANKCLMAVSSNFGANFPFGNTTAVSFNSTGVIDFTLLKVGTVAGTRFCSPYIKNMEVADLTGDGSLEYIWTWFNFDNAGGSTEEIELYAVNLDSNLKPVLQTGFPEIITGLPDESFSSTCSDQEVGKKFSPPTVYPVQGATTNQILVAFMNTDETFKIFLFDENGDFIDDFPEFTSGEGVLISNVFRGNFFPDSQDVDFCATGYENVENELQVVCASLISGDTISISKTNRYVIDTSGLFNVDTTFAKYDTISHSTNHENTLSECLDVSCASADLDEVLSPYGLHRLVRTGFVCDVGGLCELEVVFANPFNVSGAFISVDVSNSGSEDLLLLTDTNLFLFDSLFEDLGGKIDISSIVIDPCVDAGAIQINSSISISFAVDDTDPVAKAQLDKVFAQVSIYSNLAIEQISEVQGASTSGTTFFFGGGLKLNETVSIGSGIIRLFGNDTGSDDVDTFDIAFSVAETGVEQGDCRSDSFVDPDLVDVIVLVEQATTTDDAFNNSVSGAIAEISAISGLAGTSVWIFLILIGAFTLFVESIRRGASGNSAMAIVSTFVFLAIILGARLQILSAGLVVIITIIFVAILVIFLGRFMFGQGSSSM